MATAALAILVGRLASRERPRVPLDVPTWGEIVVLLLRYGVEDVPPFRAALDRLSLLLAEAGVFEGGNVPAAYGGVVN